MLNSSDRKARKSFEECSTRRITISPKMSRFGEMACQRYPEGILLSPTVAQYKDARTRHAINLGCLACPFGPNGKDIDVIEVTAHVIEPEQQQLEGVTDINNALPESSESL